MTTFIIMPAAKHTKVQAALALGVNETFIIFHPVIRGPFELECGDLLKKRCHSSDICICVFDVWMLVGVPAFMATLWKESAALLKDGCTQYKAPPSSG